MLEYRTCNIYVISMLGRLLENKFKTLKNLRINIRKAISMDFKFDDAVCILFRLNRALNIA